MTQITESCEYCQGKCGYMQPDTHGDICWDICTNCNGTGNKPK